MNDHELSIQAKKVVGILAKSEISSYIDVSLDPLSPFRGNGKIRLIILGQDPTVHDPEDRKKLKTVLLLDQPGRLRRYVEDICRGLGLDLDQNVYATNLLKNFFHRPPDTMRKESPEFFQNAAGHWIPLLKEEIEEFVNVPVLTLGEPVLNSLTNIPGRPLIRYYWGFIESGKYGTNFGYMERSENTLSRIIFPFPHLPGLKHPIYRQQRDGYLAFIRKQFFD